MDVSTTSLGDANARIELITPAQVQVKDVNVKLDEIHLLHRFHALILANHFVFQIVLFSILQPLHCKFAQIAENAHLNRQWTQGSLLFSKFEFSIKPDLRGLSFS